MTTNTDKRDLSVVETAERQHHVILWGITGLLVAILWLRPIASSLWIDELGTWWVVKDGVRDVVSRSLEIQGQSPLFYLFAWVIRQVAGPHEWALRLPSLALATATAALLYRLAKRMVDAECARLAVLMFVVWPAIMIAAIDFRPYALATFLVVSATTVLIRWLDDGRAQRGVMFVLLCAVTVYVHYLFGLAFLAYLTYALWRRREGSSKVSLSGLAMAGIGVCVLVAPLLIQVMHLWARRSEWTMNAAVTSDWVASMLVPTGFVIAAVVGGLLALTSGGVHVRDPHVSAADTVLLGSWLLMPLAALIIVAVTTSADIAVSRYALVSAPAAILILAIALRSLEPATARRVVAFCLAIVSVLTFAAAHHGGDWRGSLGAAQAAASDNTLFVVQSGFTESNQPAWLADPERRSFLLAPLSLYPVSGEVVALPFDLVVASREDALEELLASLPGVDKVVLVGGEEANRWLSALLPAPEWSRQEIATTDDPHVTSFVREPAT